MGGGGSDPTNPGKSYNCPPSIHGSILCTCKNVILLVQQEERKTFSKFVNFLHFYRQ